MRSSPITDHTVDPIRTDDDDNDDDDDDDDNNDDELTYHRPYS